MAEHNESEKSPGFPAEPKYPTRRACLYDALKELNVLPKQYLDKGPESIAVIDQTATTVIDKVVFIAAPNIAMIGSGDLEAKKRLATERNIDTLYKCADPRLAPK